MGRKILLLAVVLLALGGVLFLGRIWLVDPREIDRELRDQLSSLMGSPMEAETSSVALFPIPRVSYRNVWFEKTGIFNLKGGNIDILLSPISMARGRLRILELQARWVQMELADPVSFMETFKEKQSHLLLEEMLKMDLDVNRLTLPMGAGTWISVDPCSLRLRKGIGGATLEIDWDLKDPDGDLVVKGGEVLIQILPSWKAKIVKGKIHEPTLEFKGEADLVSQDGMVVKRVFISQMNLAQWKGLFSRFDRFGQFERIRKGEVRDLSLGFSLREKEGSLRVERIYGSGRLEGVEVILPEPWGSLSGCEGRAKISGETITIWNLKGFAHWGMILEGEVHLDFSSPNLNPRGEVRLNLDLGRWPLSFFLSSEEMRQEHLLRDLFGVRGSVQMTISLAPWEKIGWKKWSARSLRMWARHRKLPYPLEIKGEEISFLKGELMARGMELALGSSRIFFAKGSWDSKTQWITLQGTKGSLETEEILPLVRSLSPQVMGWDSLFGFSGTVNVLNGELEGNLTDWESWKGTVGLSLAGHGNIMGHELTIKDASINMTSEAIQLERIEMEIQGRALIVSGRVRDWRGRTPEGDLQLEGQMGREALQAFLRNFSESLNISLRAPESVQISKCTVELSPKRIRSKAKLLWSGETLEVEISWADGIPETLTLRIEDRDSNAEVHIIEEKGLKTLSFKGILSGSSVDELIETSFVEWGKLSGNIRASWRGHPKRALEVEGELLLEEVRSESFFPGLTVEAGAIVGEGGKLKTENMRVLWKGQEVSLKGEATLGEEVWIQARVETQRAKLSELIEAIRWLSTERPPVGGQLALRVDELEMPSFSLSEFEGSVELGQGARLLKVENLQFCGIGISGEVSLNEEAAWRANIKAKALPLRSLGDCLGFNLQEVGGTLELRGSFSSKGLDLKGLETMDGSLEIELSRLLIPEGLIGKLSPGEDPSLHEAMEALKMALRKSDGKGRLRLKGSLREGVFSFQELSLRDRGLEAVAVGQVDIWARGVEMDFLARIRDLIPGRGVPKDQFLAFRMTGPLHELSLRRLSIEEVPVGLLSKIAGQKSPPPSNVFKPQGKERSSKNPPQGKKRKR